MPVVISEEGELEADPGDPCAGVTAKVIWPEDGAKVAVLDHVAMNTAICDDPKVSERGGLIYHLLEDSDELRVVAPDPFGQSQL